MMFLVILFLLLIVAGVAGAAGFLLGRYKGHQAALSASPSPQAALELPAGFHQDCGGLWGPWGKAKIRLTDRGWVRLQRRVCETCREEEERIVYANG